MCIRDRVRVVARGASGLDFDYERAGADHRCRMDPDESKVWINEDHPVIKRYLRSADSERAGETSVEFRTMLAEMLCATVVRYGLMKKRVEPEDPSILLTAYQQKYEPLLRRINERLIQRSEISPQR